MRLRKLGKLPAVASVWPWPHVRQQCCGRWEGPVSPSHTVLGRDFKELFSSAGPSLVSSEADCVAVPTQFLYSGCHPWSQWAECSGSNRRASVDPRLASELGSRNKGPGCDMGPQQMTSKTAGPVSPSQATFGSSAWRVGKSCVVTRDGSPRLGILKELFS